VQGPESQLTANVEPLEEGSYSATAVGAMTIKTLAHELLDAFALHRGEVGEAFAHGSPETLALHRA
jgi:hypothetical protein